MCLHKI